MGYKVGIPCLKLDRQNHSPKKDKHSGNARAVLNEALEERQSADEDLNRDLTEQNIYTFEDGNERFKSGNALADEWEKRANEYKVIDKNGKQKNLRSDAGIGFALIIKPEQKFMDTLSEKEQNEFLDASDEVIENILEKYGLVIDVAVRHQDEGNRHDHIFGYDPEYKLGKKLGLPLYKEFNTEYPKRMRELGYPIDDLVGYDLDKANEMTKEEREDYKAELKLKRKSHGQTSEDFKGKKDAEAKAQEIIDKANAEAEEIKNKAEAKANESLYAVSLKEKRNNDREALLNAKEGALSDLIDKEAEKRSEAFKTALEAEKEAYKAEMDKKYADKVKKLYEGHREQERADERETEQKKFKGLDAINKFL